MSSYETVNAYTVVADCGLGSEAISPSCNSIMNCMICSIGNSGILFLMDVIGGLHSIEDLHVATTSTP